MKLEMKKKDKILSAFVLAFFAVAIPYVAVFQSRIISLEMGNAIVAIELQIVLILSLIHI